MRSSELAVNFEDRVYVIVLTRIRVFSAADHCFPVLDITAKIEVAQRLDAVPFGEIWVSIGKQPVRLRRKRGSLAAGRTILIARLSSPCGCRRGCPRSC